MMRILGVEPTERKVIVVKLGYLEPEIRAIAKRSMMALTTGSTDELFERLPYQNLPRPIYPLDTEFEAELELI
jgi:microcystin degradation protein MlrC